MVHGSKGSYTADCMQYRDILMCCHRVLPEMSTNMQLTAPIVSAAAVK